MGWKVGASSPLRLLTVIIVQILGALRRRKLLHKVVSVCRHLHKLPWAMVWERAKRSVLETVAHIELRLGFGQFGMVPAHLIPVLIMMVLLILLSQHLLSLEGRLWLCCVPATPESMRICFPIDAVSFESFHCTWKPGHRGACRTLLVLLNHLGQCCTGNLVFLLPSLFLGGRRRQHFSCSQIRVFSGRHAHLAHDLLETVHLPHRSILSLAYEVVVLVGFNIMRGLWKVELSEVGWFFAIKSQFRHFTFLLQMILNFFFIIIVICSFFLRNDKVYIDWLGFVVVAIVRDEHRRARECIVVARLFHILVFSFQRHLCCPAMFDAAIAWLLLMCHLAKILRISRVRMRNYFTPISLIDDAFLMQGEWRCLLESSVGWSMSTIVDRMYVAIRYAFVWRMIVNQLLRLLGLRPVLTTLSRCHRPTVLEALVLQC